MAPRVRDLYDSCMPLAPLGSATNLAAIAERFGLADVYVFGSRAGEISSGTRRSDTQPAGSDVDIAVRPNGARLLAPHDRVELTIELERVLHTSPVLRRAGDLAPFERERQQIVFDGGR